MTWGHSILLEFCQETTKKHFPGPSGANFCAISWMFCMRKHSLKGTFFFSTLSFNGKVYSLRPWSSAFKAGPAIWRSWQAFQGQEDSLLPAASSYTHAWSWQSSATTCRARWWTWYCPSSFSSPPPPTTLTWSPFAGWLIVNCLLTLELPLLTSLQKIAKTSALSVL